MKCLEKSKQRPYSIVITDDFKHLTDWIIEAPSSICIVTDDNVSKLYLDEVEGILRRLAPTYSHIIKHGEMTKNLNTVSEVYNTLVQHKIDRSSLVVALGGGVVGDLAGFVAATYMRGVPFIQIPTTIVAQNDSSVGGKVGVDYLNYKNMVGAFYNPSLVYINVTTLQTLPEREVCAGMGEVIKHGIIKDAKLVDYLEQNQKGILSCNTKELIDMTAYSIQIKSDIVEEDPTEKGIRKILNFGHTIGHAIESLSDFTLLHGECVGYGIVMAAYISYERAYMTEDDLVRIINLCKYYGLLKPFKCAKEEAVCECILHDKKKQQGKVDFILSKKIGETIICNDVKQDEIISALHFTEKTCQ
ncbi:MAG: 3-dehydroquinate synthase [Cellulosilyticaceae bacterium]